MSVRKPFVSFAHFWNPRLQRTTTSAASIFEPNCCRKDEMEFPTSETDLPLIKETSPSGSVTGNKLGEKMCDNNQKTL